MRLKRIYHQDKLERDKAGAVTKMLPGAVKGVQVLRAGRGIQHLSRNFIDGGVREGWLVMGEGQVMIRPVEGPAVIYRIVRAPGHYCCHCDAAIVDAGQMTAGQTKGQRHVAEAHRGQPSPDPNNPAGYRRDNFYTCVLLSGEQQNMTAEEAGELEAQVRRAFHEKIAPKLQAAAAAARAKVGGGA